MASLYIGLNRGQTGSSAGDFTIGSSTGSTDVELRIDTGKSLTRQDVYLILEAFDNVIRNEGGVGGLLLDDFAAVV